MLLKIMWLWIWSWSMCVAITYWYWSCNSRRHNSSPICIACSGVTSPGEKLWIMCCARVVLRPVPTRSLVSLSWAAARSGFVSHIKDPTSEWSPVLFPSTMYLIDLPTVLLIGWIEVIAKPRLTSLSYRQYPADKYVSYCWHDKQPDWCSLKCPWPVG